MLTKLSGEDRIKMALSMFDMVSQLMICSILEKYPEEELRKQIFLRLYKNDFSNAEKEKFILSINSNYQNMPVEGMGII
jgi:hypothetical protein